MSATAATLAYITAKDREEALRIGRSLLESRLVACINVLAGMHSEYWWESRLEQAEECVLIAKTMGSRQDEIVRKVKELHGYTVPCVVFLPISGGNPEYLAWIERECGDA